MTRMAYATALLNAEARACAFCGSVPSIRWTGREYEAECEDHPGATINQRQRRTTR